ncbi:MAG: hypothetical protein WAK96_00775 [Desulfobaccales bacterium]
MFDNKVPLWEYGDKFVLISYGLVTLLDILRFFAGAFVSVMDVLQIDHDEIGDLYLRPSHSLTQNSKLPLENRKRFSDTLKMITPDCEQLQLDGSLKLIKSIKDKLAYISLGDLQHSIVMLRELIESELDECLLLHIPEDRSGWFNKQDAFGPEVSKAYVKAMPDIKEAGNCFAVGLYTACVFHLMRVAEYGLRALAKERGITIKHKPLEWAEWGTLIREIEKTIDSLEKAHAGPEKDAALNFYRGAIGEFRAFKDVYRNPAMHPRKIYDKHEAGGAIQHVSGFMKKLSAHITEKTSKSINWKLKYTP